MIAGLERFVAQLRSEGVSASPAEWLDALRSVSALGLDDRERFRHALKCTLVKRASQHDLFDRLFDRFFAAPAWAGRKGRRRREGAGGAGGRRPGDGEEARPRHAPPRPEHRPRPHESERAGDTQRQALARSVTAMRTGEPHRRDRWRRVIVSPGPARAQSVGTRPRPPAGSDSVHPSRRELARRLPLDAEIEIAALVPRVVERIKLRTGRRLRRSRRGRLYMRRVFRDNLRHGGVPWVLPFRRRRPRRSRVVLLIDVSWSAALAAGLFLSIAGEFLRRSRDTRVLLFVDRAVDATREIGSWLAGHPSPRPGPAAGRHARRRPGDGIVRGGRSFADVVASLRGLNLEAPSDYGRAFHSLSRSRLRPGGRSTALLVLGDGRTNRFDPQDWSFEEITARCGAALWLVSEPVESWGTGDSALASYLPHVDVAVEARDLRGLARGVTELLRRL